jgi:hypothetical protein
VTRKEYHAKWREKQRRENGDIYRRKGADAAMRWYRENREKSIANNRRYKEKHKEELRIKRLKKYWTNVEKVREKNRAYAKSWRIKNPDRYRAQKKRHYPKTPEQKILHNFRTRLCLLAGKRKCSNTRALVGCDMNDFIIYIESKFEPGMSWENYGRYGWHIDHIMPCAIFDLTKPEHQKRCFHFSNLQPMWESDNCRKQDNIYEKYFWTAWEILNGFE